MDFALFGPGEVERIEVLRGSNSVAWGSAAIGGFAPPAYTFGDTAKVQRIRQQAGYGGLALAQTRRAYADPAVGPGAQSAFAGRSLRWTLAGGLALPHALRLDFGAESEWTRYASTFDPRASARIASGHALLGWTGAGGSLSLGLRRDEHDRFGRARSAGGSGTLSLAPGLRLAGSWGEGFKVPTLFQLLSYYGNAGLQPETSRSADLGLAYGAGGISASATLYRRASRNLIAFVPCASLGRCADRPYGLYANVAAARARGVELAVGAQVLAGLRLDAAYCHGETRNRTPGALSGNSLPRRPRPAAWPWPSRRCRAARFRTRS